MLINHQALTNKEKLDSRNQNTNLNHWMKTATELCIMMCTKQHLLTQQTVCHG